MSEREGGAAFPTSTWNQEAGHFMVDGGLTKREWFAGMALAGTMNGTDYLTAVRLAYQYADAMLRAGREGGDDAK